VKGKNMCTDCPKCDAPVRVQFGITNSDNIQITFLNGMSVDSEKEIKQIYKMDVLQNHEDEDMFDSILDLLEKSQIENELSESDYGDVYLDGTFVRNQIDFSKNTKKLDANHIKNVDRFYKINLIDGVPQFSWQNQIIQVVDIKTFNETIKPLTKTNQISSQIETQTNNEKSIQKCKRKELYMLSLSAKDFKYIIESSIKEDSNYFILINNQCQNQLSFSVVERAKEFSYSISFLYFSKVLEFTFFQLFNSKDFLDIVILDKFQESEDFTFWISKLNPFDCKQMTQYSKPLDSYYSNIKIKSIFLQTESNFYFLIYNFQISKLTKFITYLRQWLFIITSSQREFNP
jgi:hypothetical protein